MNLSHLYPEHLPSPVGDRLTGLHMARVISSDPERYTVQVEVEDGSTTVTAAVMTLRGHQARGWTWLPEEGELVVVAFLGGAKTRPVILGSLFDDADERPNTEEGSATLHHQSGTRLQIAANGNVTLTHKDGAEVRLDDSEAEISHPNGQRVTLSETQVLATSADGQTTLTLKDDEALLESGGSRIEVNDDGSILILPASPAIVHLGEPGSEFAVRNGDFTGPPIGDLSTHTHQVIATTTRVIVGG